MSTEGRPIVDLGEIRLGNVAALQELVNESWSPLVLFLKGFVDSMDVAEDLAQEAVVRLWERRKSLEPGSARAFLFRIGRNAAIDHLRRAKVRVRVVTMDRDPVPYPPTPADELAGSELEVRIQEALASLPPRRREVFEMIRFHSLSYREVSEVLGLSPRTVANHMAHAHRDLRRQLAKYLAEPPQEEHAGPAGRWENG